MADFISKISVGEYEIDLTGDDTTDFNVLRGVHYHKPSGESSVGTCDYDSNTTDATLQVAEAINGTVFYANKQRKVGTMPNIGKQTGVISTKDGTVAISQGYHDGTGSVGISASEKSKIVASNIAEGVQILGVTGTHKSGSTEVKQSKNVTPTFAEQVITPDEGYTCLSQVTVGAIPVTKTLHAKGGYMIVVG